MISPIDRYVIQQVKAFRQDRKLSQSKLAFEMDLPTSFIAQIESGKYEKKYNVSHLDMLARILNCSPKDFLPDAPIGNNEM
jgi:transcriptional regulator with XRE-family HTH domain